MSQQSIIINRALDGAGDWTWGQGLSSFNTGQAAVAQDVGTRLLLFLGDFFFAMLCGVDWWNLCSSKNPAAQNGIILQTRQMILGTVGGYPSSGVTSINSLNVYLNPRTRQLSLEYNINTIYTTSYTDSVTVPTNQGS
jgi:hypothetical protein